MAPFISSYKIAENTGGRQSWNGQEKNAKPIFNHTKIASLTFSLKVYAKSIRENFISMTYLPLSRGSELNCFTSKINRIHNILIGILPWQKAQFTSSYKIAEKTGDRQSWNGQERNAKPVFNYKKIASLTFSSKVDAKSIRDNFISITYLPLPRGPELNSFTSKIHRILLHSRRSFCVYLFLCLLVSTCLQESLL